MAVGATNYPASLDTVGKAPVVGTLASINLAGTTSDNVHSALHGTLGGAIIATETKIGTGASTPTATAVLVGTGSGTSAWDTTPTFGAVSITDNLILGIGSGNDGAIVNRTTVLNANTALTGVTIGTPVTPAVAANSTIVSNITASGDILVATNRGGNSEAHLWLDGSAGDTYLYARGAQMVKLTGGGGVDIGVDTTIADGKGLTVGHTAGDTTMWAAYATPEFQVLGTAADSGIGAVRYSADAFGPMIGMGKSRHADLAGNTIVADDDVLGKLIWFGADGNAAATIGAEVFARVNGTPGNGDMPTELVFATTADGASTATERLSIDAAGLSTFAGGATFGDDITLAADKSLNLPQGANIEFTDVIGDNTVDDHDAQGVIVNFTAGATITPFSPVYLAADNKVEECDADAIATMPCIGVSVNTSDVTDTNPVKVMILGLIRDDDFAFGTAGAPVYVSTTVGELTSTAPSASSDVVQIIGHSLADDAMFVQPSLTTVEIA